MSETTTTRIVVDSSIADKLREWFSAGRGVRRWTDKEIGSATRRPDVFTPADIDPVAPHWAYGSADQFELVEASAIDVETFQERTRYACALKAYYWGLGLTKASEAKAKRMLRAGERFYWIYDENTGKPVVVIGSSVIKPLVEN